MLSRLRSYIPSLSYFGIMVLVGLAAMNNQNNLLFWVFGVLLACFVLSWLLATLTVRSVQVRRADPRFGAVGEPMVMGYALTNRSRWLSVFNLHIEELEGSAAARRGLLRLRSTQSASGRSNTGVSWRRLMRPTGAWIMHAGPRETVHGEAVFWPTARGEATFDRLRVWTTFPFGIARRSRVFSQPQHTLVYPMLYELRPGLLASITPMGLMGSRIAHHAGAGDDYFGLREYRPGDSLRHISWKRTARIDQLVTIERTTPAPAKLRVVLDLTSATQRLPAAAGDARRGREMEERAISLAASLIHAADLAGFEIGLTMLGFGAQPIALRRNQWHFHKIMAALAQIDLDRPRTAERPMPVRDAERAAIVVIAPDRVQPLGGREDALYLTASSLEGLAQRPLGWQEGRGAAERQGAQASRHQGIAPARPSAPSAREAAA